MPVLGMMRGDCCLHVGKSTQGAGGGSRFKNVKPSTSKGAGHDHAIGCKNEDTSVQVASTDGIDTVSINGSYAHRWGR